MTACLEAGQDGIVRPQIAERPPRESTGVFCPRSTDRREEHILGGNKVQETGCQARGRVARISGHRKSGHKSANLKKIFGRFR